TTAAAAPAQDAVALVVYVGELAGEAAGAAVQVPLEHESGAEAVGDLDVDEVLQAGGGAESALAERAEVGIVLDPHWQAKLVAELELDHAALAVDGHGQAGDGADEVGASALDVGQGLVEQLDRVGSQGGA